MNFTERYQKLNTHQRQAVDTIDGPVMVVAGPGTGKTELLSMRAANILKQTDVLPENILCLTFTESGSVAMQQRLADIIGRDAYNVSIHTFHAFGSEIISRHREYFYNGAQFQPADELNQRRIITDILTALPHDNPLRTTMNGEFTTIGAIQSAISDIKRSGLTESELLAVLKANDEVIERAEPLLAEVFAGRVGKTTFDKLTAAAEELTTIDEPQPIAALPRLSDVLRRSLQRALLEASDHPKITPPLTEWKKQWLTLDESKSLILKAKKQQHKLHALLQIYGSYCAVMQKAELYDFDDMIGQVVHAMEVRAELRYELQEKYQYIMVDEFQDTNLAQMRILMSLTDNPVNEGKPNILTVGDDDQAIYGFQGADVGNILAFRTLYPAAKLITLTDNYRSAPQILSAARKVITQGEERLERHITELNKTLTAHTPAEKSRAELHTLPTIASERSWLIHSIKQQLAHGTPAHEIAVLARRHSDLEALLPYFTKANIPISYDKRDNVLEDDVVMQLERIARLVLALYRKQLDIAEELLPQVLSHPAWGIAPETVWKISLLANSNKKHWLEIMQTIPETKALFTWLVSTTQQVPHTPLERMLDTLIGHEAEDDDTLSGETTFVSPLKEYYFSKDPADYYTYLANLSAIRTRLREHDPDTSSPRLGQFIDFIDQIQAANISITSLRHVGEDTKSVRLLSAHASKGLEFDTVYVINAVDSNWGSKARTGVSIISYPENMRLRQNNNSLEERLRLFFVAMTRAKRKLFISRAEETATNKPLLLANFLVGDHQLDEISGETPAILEDTSASIELEWYAPLLSVPPATMREQLASVLERYKLSATHINNFIDIERGGPQHFLLNNLLHFPSARGPHAGYGNAIHTALQQAHDYLVAHGTRQPEEDILRAFEQALENERLSDDELTLFSAKGSDALRTFLAARYDTFSPQQRAELNLADQQARLGDVHMTGKLDVVTIDQEAKTIRVIDYKTGGTLASWEKGSDYQKIKAHKYRQQLLFYKLLLENSREWRNYNFTGGSIQFVEPDKAGNIVELSLDDVSEEELADFTDLVTAIWRHIQALDFPDTSQYEPTLAGIKAFETDLRARTPNAID